MELGQGISEEVELPLASRAPRRGRVQGLSHYLEPRELLHVGVGPGANQGHCKKTKIRALRLAENQSCKPKAIFILNVPMG